MNSQNDIHMVTLIDFKRESFFFYNVCGQLSSLYVQSIHLYNNSVMCCLLPRPPITSLFILLLHGHTVIIERRTLHLSNNTTTCYSPLV